MSRRNPRPKGSPRPAAQALEVALNLSGLSPLMKTVQVVQAWPRAVGKQLARQCKPLQLVQGDLTVGVPHPAWKQELHLRQGDILARLAEIVGPGVVRALVIRVTAPAVVTPPPLVPDEEARAFGAQAAREVTGDEAVREAVARAAAAQRALSRRGRAGGGRP